MSNHLKKLAGVTALLALLGSAQAACSSPYYPIREGLSRSYQGTINGQTVSYTETVSKVSSTGFTITTTVKGGGPPTSATFKCGPNGVIGTPSLNNPVLKVTSIKQTGVTQPPTLSVGRTWSSGVTVESTIEGQKMVNQTDVSMKVIATEKVTTKLGTYTALKVSNTTKVKMTMAGQNLDQPPVNTTSWLVKDIGMVKITMPGGSIELVKFK